VSCRPHELADDIVDGGDMVASKAFAALNI